MASLHGHAAGSGRDRQGEPKAARWGFLYSEPTDCPHSAGDVVVVTKNDKGTVKLHQAQNLTALGAVSGTFWGLLIGLIFLSPLLGAAVGAGAGALSGALADAGISDNFMKDLAASLKPDSSALFVLMRKVTADKVLDELKAFTGKGKILQTSLTN